MWVRRRILAGDVQRLEHLDAVLVVLHDVVVIQAVTVLTEVELAFGSLELLDARMRLRMFSGLRAGAFFIPSAKTRTASYHQAAYRSGSWPYFAL
jgi:hypothetical protein